MARSQTGTTATATPEVVSSRHHALVAAANAALTPIRARHDAAVERVKKYHSILRPAAALPDASGNTPVSPSIDPLARLEALSNLAAANLDVLKLEQELATATRAVDEARELARREIAATAAPHLRAAVQTLRIALHAARDANDVVQQLQIAQADAIAQPYEPVSVTTLAGLVEYWESRVAAAGFLAD